jgi:hypothetical protein
MLGQQHEESVRLGTGQLPAWEARRMVVPAAGAPAGRVPLFPGLPVVGPSIWPYFTYVIMHVLASTVSITERWWGALAPDRERRCRPRWLPGVGCAGEEA